MQEGVNNEEDHEKEKIAENEDESVIHRDMTENEHGTNWDTFDKSTQVCPDDTSPVEMEEGVNNEEDHKKQKTAQNEDESVIHRDITEN